MNDLISRQAAIDALGEGAMVNYQAAGHNNGLIKAIDVIKGLPSAQPDHDEWCHDSKEYDKEKHSCPRWNRVIRNTLKDAQPEIIRCKDCKHKHLENMVWTCPFGLPGGENFFCGYGAEPYKGE